jgi:hypothetical protein
MAPSVEPLSAQFFWLTHVVIGVTQLLCLGLFHCNNLCMAGSEVCRFPLAYAVVFNIDLVPPSIHCFSMSSHTADDDDESTFSGNGEAYSFNLKQLQRIVSEKLGKECTLRKLAEGGNHKVKCITNALVAH